MLICTAVVQIAALLECSERRVRSLVASGKARLRKQPGVKEMVYSCIG